MEAGFVAYLNGYAALTALVSTRIYPGRLPKGYELPALTYGWSGGPGDMALDGPSEIEEDRVTINIWAESYGETITIGAVVRTALLGFDGTMRGVRVWITKQLLKRDDQDPETGLYRRILDFRVHHK